MISSGASAEVALPSARSNLVASWLGMTLGFVGAGRFYVGDFRLGSAQAGLTAVGLSMGASWGGFHLTQSPVVCAVIWGAVDGFYLLRATHDARGQRMR